MTHDEAMALSLIKTAKRYVFNYPVEFTSLDDYSAHRGQTVTVLRPCSVEEADILWDNWRDQGEEIVDRMFKVRADDGWEGDAWESELLSGGEVPSADGPAPSTENPGLDPHNDRE